MSGGSGGGLTQVTPNTMDNIISTAAAISGAMGGGGDSAKTSFYTLLSLYGAGFCIYNFAMLVVLD